jgi:uncharacterized DUF497 family protein
MAKFEFIEWLLVWLLETSHFEFEWDRGNETKSAAKHGVTMREAEEIFNSGQAAALGVQVSPKASEERLGIVGATSSGRILHVVFTLRNGKVRPISARPAHKKERRYYEENLREISQGI